MSDYLRNINRKSIGYSIVSRSEQNGFMDHQTKKNAVELINKTVSSVFIIAFFLGLIIGVGLTCFILWLLR